MNRSGYLAVTLMLILAGCAGQSTREATSVNWKQHSSTLQGFHHWTANGKLALRTDERAESATIVWQQQGQNSELQLSGPLGLGATTIHSDGQQLQINKGNEVTTVDISTPNATARNTGWNLPLQALPYWLKGMPSPDFELQLFELDPDNDLLRNLRQDNWDINYEQYQQFDELMLPTRLRIHNGSTSARMIIRHWQTAAE